MSYNGNVNKRKANAMTKLKTINLKGNEYAKVPERIRQFREDCPNGSITTSPAIQDDGQVIFTATVVKDRAKEESAMATGHALGKANGDKAFEKLETIAVGRALAMLGYLASGEVASAEEMEDFYAYREQQIQDKIELIESAKDLDSLKKIFTNMTGIADKRLIAAKDARKAKFNEDSKTTAK
jgi:hypothetical protein